MNIWDNHLPGSGSCTCKGPEVGVCLACSKPARRPVWLVSESRVVVAKSIDQRENHVRLINYKNSNSTVEVGEHWGSRNRFV